MGKTHRKNQPQARARTTRSSKPRLLLADPSESSAQLTSQLRALGLYAAPTLGDGNCLFRALSDQLYGSPSKHAQLRQEICTFIVKHKTRYEPFVEDERGLDVHIGCMRENATYGGHLELSAFAQMVKRNVKVVQPGLVYVIEWAAGLDENEQEKAFQQPEGEAEEEGVATGTVYVAYHDWEHFSSIRNLKGPHTGLPNVTETPPAVLQQQVASLTPKEREKEAKRERERERKEKEKARKILRVKLKLSAPSPVVEHIVAHATIVGSTSAVTATSSSAIMIQDPTLIPLPESRSASAFGSRSSTSTPAPEGGASAPLSAASSLSSISSSSSQSQQHAMLTVVSMTAVAASSLPPSMRAHRSPKRSFDESASSEDGQSHAGDVGDDVERGRGRDKRSRIGSTSGGVPVDAMDVDNDTAVAEKGREETPGLSAPGSSSSSSSSSSSVSEEDEDVEVAADTVEAEVKGGLVDDDDDGYSSLSELESSPPPTPAPTEPLVTVVPSKAAIGRPQHLSRPPAARHDPGQGTSPAHKSSKPLTRRQRKALGLPKPRAALVFGADNNSPGAGRVTSGAGKIVIPGGRFKGRRAVVKVREFTEGEGDCEEGGAAANGEVEEWVRSGVGRVDVRGFRELKI